MDRVEVRKTVYVVEDEPGIRVLHKAILAAYDVRDFASGGPAIEAVRQNPWEASLLLTDRNLPDIKGEDVVAECQRIWLAQVPPRTVPIIMVTSPTADYDPTKPDFRRILSERGVNEVLLKPFQPKQLVILVSELLQ